MDNDIIKINVCEDRNVGGLFARAHQMDGQERDVPLYDTDETDDDVRDTVRCDCLVGDVPADCPVSYAR